MKSNQNNLNSIFLKDNKNVFKIVSFMETKKIYIVGFFLLLVSFMDLISLGSLPILVGTLLNENFINNNEFEFLGEFRSYLSHDKIFYSVFIIFLLKVIINLLFLVCWQQHFFCCWQQQQLL